MSLKTDFNAFNDGHVRIAVLRLLDGAPGYQANDSVIVQAVQAMALACTRDQLRGHLAWLEEMRLIRLADLGGLKVAELTERGADVANGRSTVAGVQKPSPKG